MKIVKLTAENVKKLRAVEITPRGEVVTIAGRNGQGKTSLLDSLFWALSGTSHIQSQPIRKGENKALIRLDLGDIIVERRFTEGKVSTVTVESADGARYSSPQALLDKLVGALSFDPLAFARMDARQQYDELRRVVNLDIDVEKLSGLNKADYDRRTDINREAKNARAQAEGIVIPSAPESGPIDESALVDALQRAGETNADIETRKERRKSTAERRDQMILDGNTLLASAVKASAHAGDVHKAAGIAAREAYERAQREANAALQKALAVIDDMEREGKAKIAAGERLGEQLTDAEKLPEPIDVSALRERIEKARAVNRAIEERAKATERRDVLLDTAKTAEKRADELTAIMAARTQAATDAIARATMPVPGLGFGEGHVTYNGIPFDQCSSAEQLKVSMSIAMSANPKLRVIRITDGSLLDDDSMAAIAAMAKAGDFQVWCERVDGSGKVGIVIDDGAVVSTPESRAELALEGAAQ